MIGSAWRYGAVFALGAAIAATAQAWRYDAQIARGESSISSERAEAVRLVLAEQESSAVRMAEVDKKHTRDLSDAKDKIADLERRVAVGSSGLRVSARCPAVKPVPEAGTAPGVGSGDGESAELDTNARPDYFALRRGIVRLESALRVCVDGR